MARNADGADDFATLFADADIFHASAVPPYVVWGATGIKLLRRIEGLVAQRLQPLGYEEIRLPTLCRQREMVRYLGPGAQKLLRVASGRDPALVLAPFSDIQFLHHVQAQARQRRRSKLPHQAYAWSRCFLNERGRGFFDFGEYAKCEIFSIHASRRAAVAAWEGVNASLAALCREDLCLDPLCGTRPGITTFPFAERTFSAELGQGRDGFQTLLVSHLMESGFTVRNGFVDLKDAWMNSACFSQKLLAALLLHHRDADGFRYPPALAPALIVAIGVPQIDPQTARRERIRPQRKDKDPYRAMVETGAICALTRNSHGKWLLYRRGLPKEPPSRHASWKAALLEAKAYLKAFALGLREQSRRALETRIAGLASPPGLELRSAAERDGVNRLLACCNRRPCQTRVAELSGWLPKLASGVRETRRCVVCGEVTAGILLLEREERYTSFYRLRPSSARHGSETATHPGRP